MGRWDRFTRRAAASAVMLTLVAAGKPVRLEQMRWQRRILLVSAPSANDPQLSKQRMALSSWRQGAADRDVTTVYIVGHDVQGAADPAKDLRKRYHLLGGTFEIVLIGKDGHVAFRSKRPAAPQDLQGLIDAMPMRRAGQR